MTGERREEGVIGEKKEGGVGVGGEGIFKAINHNTFILPLKTTDIKDVPGVI